MLKKVEEFGKSQLETLSTTSTVLAKGLKQIAEETTSYSKKHVETATATFQELLGAKTVEKAIEIQTGFAKQAYEGFVAQSTKVVELYTGLLKEVAKPAQEAFAKVQAATPVAQPAPVKNKAA